MALIVGPMLLCAGISIGQAPAGQRIACWCSADPGGIWTMGANGENPEFVATGRDPACSPNGSKIAFVHLGILRVVDTGGTRLRQVHVMPGLMRAPSWSPDGTRIAFEYRLPAVDGVTQGRDIYTIRPDGTGARNVTNNPKAYNRTPAWSPDGSRIAFVANPKWSEGIWTVAPDGGDLQHIVGRAYGTGPEEVEVLDTAAFAMDFCHDPTWSPSGRRIAFAYQQLVFTPWPELNLVPAAPVQIAVVDADGGDPVAVTHSPTNKYDPDWSPDGSQFVYATGQVDPDPDAPWVYDLRVYDIASGTDVALTDDGESRKPAWFSPIPYEVSPVGKLGTTWAALKGS